jgi:hypothetical protein
LPEPYQRGSRNGSLLESAGNVLSGALGPGGGGSWFLQLPRSSTGSSPPVASPAPGGVHRGTTVARAREEGHDGCAVVAGGELGRRQRERGRWMGAGDAMDGGGGAQQQAAQAEAGSGAGRRGGRWALDPCGGSSIRATRCGEDRRRWSAAAWRGGVRRRKPGRCRDAVDVRRIAGRGGGGRQRARGSPAAGVRESGGGSTGQARGSPACGFGKIRKERREDKERERK